METWYTKTLEIRKLKPNAVKSRPTDGNPGGNPGNKIGVEEWDCKQGKKLDFFNPPTIFWNPRQMNNYKRHRGVVFKKINKLGIIHLLCEILTFSGIPKHAIKADIPI
jgi:hypothetical protein